MLLELFFFLINCYYNICDYEETIFRMLLLK